MVSPAKVVPIAALVLAGGEYGVGEADAVTLLPVAGLVEFVWDGGV